MITRRYTERLTHVTRVVFPTALVVAGVFVACPVRGQPPEPERGIFVTVANPVTSEVVNAIKERIARAQRDKPVQKFVFDFNPDGRETSTAEYGPSHDLAKFIKNLNVQTIAFVHGPVTRHSVLPVLACQELVMSPADGVVLGPVLVDPAGSPDEDEVAYYARVAGKAREALALKMLDRSVAVLEGRLPNGAVTYFDARKRAEAEREGVAGISPQPVLPAGTVWKYTADEALKFGLCQAKLESRQEVAERYRLAPSTLGEDPLQGRIPEAWLIKVRGGIDRGLAETLGRKLDRAKRQGANIIFLQLEAQGGDFAVAGDLAEDLRRLTKTDGIPVVAFIPRAADDATTFLALGCTEIVMAKGATLGQFKHLLEAPPNFRQVGGGRRRQPQPPPQVVNLEPIGKSLAKLAEQKGYPPLIFQALTDPSIEVWQVVSQKGTAERKFITKEELDADRQAAEPRWGQAALVKPAGQLLELTAEKAYDFGIATAIVSSPDDPREVFAKFGVSRAKEPPADWLDKLGAFLRDPVVAMFLVVLGITCLILELKMPGVGVPGVIAAVCFVLFFWSQTQMNAEMTLLAVLLFLLGLVLLGIEIFIIPGFGVTGFSGILLVLAGLALATVEHLPQTSGEYVDFGLKLLQLGLGLVGSTIAAFVVARYLPSIPYANRLVLAPPGEKEGVEDATAASGAYESLAALLGTVGTSATALRPAGMALFGDAYVDVVSEGNYIPAGARVQVIEIEGNRVVVKEV
jgi:membrane-bound serine protease (ClpP class)